MFVLMFVLSIFAFGQEDIVYVEDTIPVDLLAGGLFAAMAGVIIAVIIFAIIVYIFQAIALMTIAKKTNTPNAWMAWIPIANIYLMTQIGQVPWWTIFGLVLAAIPIIGGLCVAALVVYLWWKIAEKRGFPGWFGILQIVPIVNLVIMGIIAWGKGSEMPIGNSNDGAPMNPDVARVRKYASDAMAAGKGLDQIKKELKDAGWSDDIIKKAF